MSIRLTYWRLVQTMIIRQTGQDLPANERNKRMATAAHGHLAKEAARIPLKSNTSSCD
jgi:hypothetical protein